MNNASGTPSVIRNNIFMHAGSVTARSGARAIAQAAVDIGAYEFGNTGPVDPDGGFNPSDSDGGTAGGPGGSPPTGCFCQLGTAPAPSTFPPSSPCPGCAEDASAAATKLGGGSWCLKRWDGSPAARSDSLGYLGGGPCHKAGTATGAIENDEVAARVG